MTGIRKNLSRRAFIQTAGAVGLGSVLHHQVVEHVLGAVLEPEPALDAGAAAAAQVDFSTGQGRGAARCRGGLEQVNLVPVTRQRGSRGQTRDTATNDGNPTQTSSSRSVAGGGVGDSSESRA